MNTKIINTIGDELPILIKVGMLVIAVTILDSGAVLQDVGWINIISEECIELRHRKLIKECIGDYTTVELSKIREIVLLEF